MRMMIIKHIYSSINTRCQTLCPFLVSDILLLSRLSFKLQLACELILNSLPCFLLSVTRASHTNFCLHLVSLCLRKQDYCYPCITYCKKVQSWGIPVLLHTPTIAGGKML